MKLFLLHVIYGIFTIATFMPGIAMSSMVSGSNNLTTLGRVVELRATKDAIGIVSGDFNDDGRYDIATFGGRHLQISYQNIAAGSWRTTGLKLASNILRCSVGRLNRDHLSDVVVLTSDPPTLIVLLAKPREKLSIVWRKNISRGFDKVLLADLDNDHILDIILYGTREVGIMLYHGRGNGSFDAKGILLTDYSFSNVHVTDINGDSVADVLGTDWVSNRLVMFSGFGNLTFSDPSFISFRSEPNLVCVAPVDSDGIQDIIVGSTDEAWYEIFRGNGLGEFNKVQSIALDKAPTDLSVQDMNGDGKQDVVLFSRIARIIIIDLNAGKEGMGDHAQFGCGRFPLAWCMPTDRDGSNRDIAILDGGSGSVRILQSASRKVPLGEILEFAVGTAPTSVLSNDLNRDGWEDLIVSHSGSNQISLFMNDGNGGFDGQIPFPLTPPVRDLTYLVKNDTLSLLIGTSVPPGKISIVEVNKLDYSHSSFALPTLGHATILAARIDSVTKLLSILTLQIDSISNRTEIVVAEQINRTKFVERTVTPAGAFNMEAGSVADLNRDGVLDLVYCTYSSVHNRVEVFHSLGSRDWTFQPGKLGFATPETSRPSVTLWTPDLNSDGVSDLLLNLGQPRNLLMLAYGSKDTSGWSKELRIQNPIEVNSKEYLQVTDITGDGVNDIVLLNERTKSIQLYSGRANGTFMPSSRLAKAEGVASFVTTDINNDLVPELILTSSLGGSLRIISLKEE